MNGTVITAMMASPAVPAQFHAAFHLRLGLNDLVKAFDVSAVLACPSIASHVFFAPHSLPRTILNNFHSSRCRIGQRNRVDVLRLSVVVNGAGNQCSQALSTPSDRGANEYIRRKNEPNAEDSKARRQPRVELHEANFQPVGCEALGNGREPEDHVRRHDVVPRERQHRDGEAHEDGGQVGDRAVQLGEFTGLGVPRQAMEDQRPMKKAPRRTCRRKGPTP